MSVFISHASADDGFVKELRDKLEAQGVSVWVDSRNLRGGDKLNAEIEQAIQAATHVLAVLSPKTINSPWVRKEIQSAEQVAKTKPDYRVIPLMLPGIEPAALLLWFEEEPVGVKIALEPGQLQEALPQILAALGVVLPNDPAAAVAAPSRPMAELLLELRDPKLAQQENGLMELSAEAVVVYTPPDTGQQPEVKSRRFRFVAPIGPIEQERLRWYLEKFYRWPAGHFLEDAAYIEQQIPHWGQKLFQASLGQPQAQAVYTGWREARAQAERRFSLRVDADVLDGDGAARQAAQLAASRLQSLPWELLHDGKAYLSEGAEPVRVRRRLPNYDNQLPRPAALPIRILLASPRPEQAGVRYINHRISAKPLVEALDELGDLAELTILNPPTLPALEQALRSARAAGRPFHVLHFDGHGVYDAEHGLGALCFEDPQDQEELENRRMQLVDAETLARLLLDHRIPLVFLEACQSAHSETDPTASVAARLLEAGVSSVVAMSHSVLVETARRFVTAFYQSLAEGQRVGSAMLAGQTTLQREAHRGTVAGAGELRLQDWFVPVLYQEAHDPSLFSRRPSAPAARLHAADRAKRLGQLPPPPPHQFVGRSRELLGLERLLELQPYAVITGIGGEGKTTLAVELARWLVQTRRFHRCAFVSLEQYSDLRGVVDSLGQQMLPQYSVAEYGDDMDKALQPIQRELADHRCMLVFDNLESLLAEDTAAGLLGCLAGLLTPSSSTGGEGTRLLFTSREPLPTPFNHKARHINLSRLRAEDAEELLIQVLRQEGKTVRPDEQGYLPQAITDLIEAVNRHARALVLLAPELHREGLAATTQSIRQTMAELQQRHPGQREFSLYASVELSLRRLSPQAREWVQGLAVFEDGGIAWSVSQVIGITQEQAQALLAELVAVGLAEQQAYTYHRLDPALPAYLVLSLDEARQESYRQRWRQAMAGLVDFLYQQLFEDIQLSARLSLLELPNLLAYLHQLAESVEAGRTDAVALTVQAGSVEQLLANLHRPQALSRVVKLREQAARHLGTWNHARFEHERLSIERLLDQGALPQAFASAQALWRECQQAGEQAYPGADYDTAGAFCLLGQVLETGGAAAQALPLLQEAQRRFECLGEDGAQMAAVALGRQGDCLLFLGQLDGAAAAYEERIRRGEKLDDQRGVAVGKGQLATVRLEQKRYGEALQGYREALQRFESMGETGSMAGIWHQIGIVYRRCQDFPQAEQDYQQSLALRVQRGDQAGEALGLLELGNLNRDWNRPEAALKCSQQAAELYSRLGDRRYEGAARSNLAMVLMPLDRYDQARRELQRALECKQEFGAAAQPWKTWDLLSDLELATGNPAAAEAARQQALQSYLAYRRDGGENHSGAGRLVEAVWQGLRQRDVSEISQIIPQWLEHPDWQEDQTFLRHLQAILEGARDMERAADASLHYETAAELCFLLERLAAAGL